MKTKTVLLLITTLTLFNLNAFAQGLGGIRFANTTSNRVFLCDGTPVPRASDGGTYLAELLYALDGADFATATRTGLPTTFNTPEAGVFQDAGRIVLATQNGGFGQFQVRVWDTRGGLTYEAVLASNDPLYWAGASPIFRRDMADPTMPPLLEPLHMPSFTVGPVDCIPEPSTYALFALGAGALWFFRRRMK